MTKDIENVLRCYWQQETNENGYTGGFSEWLRDPENESEINTVIEFYENN